MTRLNQPPLVITPLQFYGGPLDGLRGLAKGIKGAHFPEAVQAPEGAYQFRLTHDRVVYTFQPRRS